MEPQKRRSTNKAKQRRIRRYFLQAATWLALGACVTWEGNHVPSGTTLLLVLDGTTPGITFVLIVSFIVLLMARKRTIRQTESLMRRLTWILLVWFLIATGMWALSHGVTT